MSRTHPTPFASVRRAFALLAAALAMLLVATAHAQPTSGVQWVQTSLTTPAGELFTPASGALFVRAEGGLMRSNDGGDSWTPVPLPRSRQSRASVTAGRAVSSSIR